MLRVKWWQDYLYPTPESRDPGRQFVNLVKEVIGQHHRVLDVGSGAGERNNHGFRGNCTEKLVNATELFSSFRAALLCNFVKPPVPEGSVHSRSVSE